MKAILRAADGFGADLNVTNTSELQKRQSHGTMPVRYTYQVKCVQTEGCLHLCIVQAECHSASPVASSLRILFVLCLLFNYACRYVPAIVVSLCLKLAREEQSHAAMQRKILARNKESGSEHQYTGYQKTLRSKPLSSHRCAHHVLRHHVLLWYSPTVCC